MLLLVSITFVNETETNRWASWAADGVLCESLKTVEAVGGVELSEEGGGEGGLHHQHVPGEDLLLCHHVTTL